MTLTFDRKRVAQAMEKLERRVINSREKFRAMGRAMREAGGGVELAAFMVGSAAWTEWLEGWSGTEAPRREVVAGSFDMTPAQELQARIDWLRSIGVAEAQVGQAVEVFRRGYTPEALGGDQ